MKKFVGSFFILALITLCILTGCGPTKPTNEAPRITNTSPSSPLTVEVNKKIVFSVIASDPNGDQITYKWSATKGTFDSATATDVTWTAPNTTGPLQVTVTVSDGKAETKYTWNVTVSPESSVVNITSDINTDTTFSFGKTYVLDSINLYAHLTIEPGVIIKFKENSYLNILESGSITANGTIEKPIIFTSIRDDSQGGDTNKDGTSSKPAAGDWDHIALDNSRKSTFSHCYFYYGGSSYQDSTLLANNSEIVVDNCTFAYNKGIERGVLDLSSAKLLSKVTNSKFYGNHIPLSINPNLNIDNSNEFKDPKNPSITNVKNGIYLSDYACDLSQSVSWSETDVPFIVTTYLNINPNKTLTLSPGVVLKFQNDETLVVYGSIKAKGTSDKPIIFTSIYHDILGDTNGDGTSSKPNPGDWRHIYIEDSPLLANEFEYCQFLYGGRDVSNDSVLAIVGTSAVLQNCTFAYSNGASNGALNLASARNMTVSSLTFYGNEIPLTINSQINVTPGNKFAKPDNSTVKNVKNGIFLDESVWEFESNISWTETAVPFVIQTSPWIATKGKITLANGVIIKFCQDSGLEYPTGGLVNYAGAKFTAFCDDSIGGDTNGDGPSNGYNGAWDGIYNSSTSKYENWSNIYFAANK